MELIKELDVTLNFSVISRNRLGKHYYRNSKIKIITLIAVKEIKKKMNLSNVFQFEIAGIYRIFLIDVLFIRENLTIPNTDAFVRH